MNHQQTIHQYRWRGLDRFGQQQRGIIEACDLNEATTALRKQGIAIRVITQKIQFFNRHKKIKLRDIAVFSRQLATMVNTGISLIQSFNLIIQRETNQRMQYLLTTIKNNIEAGGTLAESLQKHPALFTPLVCNLISAGEHSGSLDTMLQNVATYHENIEAIKKKVKKALYYPFSIVVIAFLITLGLLVYVIPQFEALFKGFGAELPLLTRKVIYTSHWINAHAAVLSMGTMSSIFSVVWTHRSSTKFKTIIDELLLNLPLIGRILHEGAIARFSRTLSITFAAGLPLMGALAQVAEATGHYRYKRVTHQIKNAISQGQSMHMAMHHTSLFPPLVIQFVAIGEESGTLDEMLSKLADIYEKNVDNAIDTLCGLLEPIIMTIIGLLVGGLIVTMYLPLFTLGSIL